MEEVRIDRFPAILGRSNGCDASVPISFVSRRHCRFTRQGAEVLVQDLESLNGTFVNDRPAPFPTPLRDGDELRLGPTTFRVALVASHGSGTLLLGATPTDAP
jgi:pSer/pThr/pTyr-binding forkhead associated (FHA) protein